MGRLHREDDKHIPLAEDLSEAAMEEGKRVAEQHLDETAVCKVLKGQLAARLATHARAHEDIEQRLSRSISSDKAFASCIDKAREHAVKTAAMTGFDDFEPRRLEPSSGLADALRKELEKAVSTGKDATGVDKHVAGLLKRFAGIGIVYDEASNEPATLGLIRKGIQPNFDKAMSAFFDKYSVTDTAQRADLKGYAEMSTEDAIKAKLGHIRDAVLKKLVADEEVRQALEKVCKQAWKEACKQWMESVVEQAWDPRKALIDWAEMAVYPKHLLGTSEADARKKATLGMASTGPRRLVSHSSGRR